MKWFVFLWERHLAAMIVAGAYSAEVALATKAGSHSHKGDTSLPSRMAQRAISRYLRSRPSTFSAAVTVASMCASVWAADRNRASNWDGAM